jgi:hypothetical protein
VEFVFPRCGEEWSFCVVVLIMNPIFLDAFEASCSFPVTGLV